MKRPAFTGGVLGLRPGTRARRGSAAFSALVLVLVCVSLAGANMVTAKGWHGESTTLVRRERALQLAEGAVDWGIARLRARHGALPGAPESGTVPGVGTWNVDFQSGTDDGADDDGDGDTDEADEGRFTVLTCTGNAGNVQRTLRILMRNPEKIIGFDAAAQLNVDAPIVDVNGGAFTVRGAEHLLDGTLDTTRPEKYALVSPADPTTVINQIPLAHQGNLSGRGADPSIGQASPVDLNGLVQEAQAAASIMLTPGTYANRSFGTPVEGGTEIVSVRGDLHLSGGTTGAGILVVDGDLTISGGFEWVGIVLVRGRVTLSGGGSTKKIIGSMIVGEEVSTGVGGDMTLNGGVDLLYSTDAVTLAAQSLVIPALILWREAPNP